MQMTLFGTTVEIAVEERGKTKRCVKCKQIKDYDCFPKANGASYPRAECKECNKRLSQQRKKHREEQGEPPEDHRCPICLLSEQEIGRIGGNAGVWCVDHNHKTNKFRGYLPNLSEPEFLRTGESPRFCFEILILRYPRRQ